MQVKDGTDRWRFTLEHSIAGTAGPDGERQVVPTRNPSVTECLQIPKVCCHFPRDMMTLSIYGNCVRPPNPLEAMLTTPKCSRNTSKTVCDLEAKTRRTPRACRRLTPRAPM
jgi:hypothetical protein